MGWCVRLLVRRLLGRGLLGRKLLGRERADQPLISTISISVY
jgi:hypothetical protein